MSNKWLIPLATVAFGLLAPAAHAEPGQLRVRDDAGVFSPEGVRKAERAFADTSFPRSTQMTVVTAPDVPESRRADLPPQGDPGRPAFFRDWAKELAKQESDRGLFVLIVMGSGHFVEVLADETTDLHRGFSESKCKRTQGILARAFGEAKGKPDQEARAARDAGLLMAVEYVAAELKETPATGHSAPNRGLGGVGAGGLSLGSMVCLGLVGLMAVWLVIGLFRAMSGGGAGAAGPGGMAGGGGFFTSLLGGMFGAAAGMWMYDQFFGGGASSAAAAEPMTGFNGATDGATDTGAGNWDGGASAGGDFDDPTRDMGDIGGGDFGGGDW